MFCQKYVYCKMYKSHSAKIKRFITRVCTMWFVLFFSNIVVNMAKFTIQETRM
jgi:hypothetical protein